MSEFKVCSKCGTKNQFDNNFCEHCGYKLSSSPLPQLKSSKEKEPSHKTTNNKTASPIITTSPKEKTVVANAATPTTPNAAALTSPPSNRFNLSWKIIIYFILFSITIFTRFYKLGNKPHHHDESMHSFYSFELWRHGTYQYNPMLHGPFQFHGNAFMFYLFGVSNATSRFLAAFFGLLTVGLAFLLEPFIGEMGALITTALLVFSPSYMYFDRFTREDAYIAGATFLMVVFLFRFCRTKKPIDFWLASLGFAIAFCTKESMFLTIAVLGTYLFVQLLPTFDVIIAGGLSAIAVLSQLIIPRTNAFRVDVLFIFLVPAFIYTIVRLIMEGIKNKQASVSTAWDIVLSLEWNPIKWEIVGFLSWWVIAIIFFNIPSINVNHPTFLSLILAIAYIALLFRFLWLWLNNISPSLSGGISIFGMVFTLLFSTFYTVGTNAFTFLGRVYNFVYSMYFGAFGGLQYWWQQRLVHRGDEPWYYYLLLLPAEETISFLFGIIAIIYYVFFNRKKTPIFLIWWYVGSLMLFSWAGEKMPWLILHPLLPTLILTGYFLGDLWESKNPKHTFKSIRAGTFVIAILLFSYSIHSAVLLNFYHAANPVEPLVYVQSGPDVKRVVHWIKKISYDETGGDNIHITIESTCSWPFAWYLRKFHYVQYPNVITNPQDPIILTATETDARNYYMLKKAGYIDRKYKMRLWWIPSWFKSGYPEAPMTFQRFFSWLWGNFTPFGTKHPSMVDWHDIVNWVLYRKVWSPLGSYNMRLWIKKKLAKRYCFTRTTRSDIQTGYPLPKPVLTATKKITLLTH